MSTAVQMEESWKKLLNTEFEKEYFQNIRDFLTEEKKKWKTIYPSWWDIFNAFNSTSVEEVKVVILWQDPYYGPGQAHGLCFSVQEWIKQPPSLKNIFKELESDLGILPPSHGSLQKWAGQWVFLLNAILTVERWLPASHAKIWWEDFTDAVIENLSKEKDGLIFLLWWSFAQSKKYLIDESKHHILETTHPSPFSAHRGFLWCRHFSQVNEILSLHGKPEIDRSL